MINILVALNSEAKPIRQALKLKSIQDSAPWRCYASDQYRLVVTGSGSLNMAMATSWLYGAYGKASLWVNVGTVGHKHAEIGRVVITSKIKDHSSGQAWFIPILLNSSSTGTVCTVERTKVQFSDLQFYDMEAAGFIQAALRVTERERIHSIKIVSDNELEQSGDMDDKKLLEIVEGATETVVTRFQQIYDSLQLGLASSEIRLESDVGEKIELNELRRVSSAQEHRWRELKRRWQAVGWSSDELVGALGIQKSTTDFLDWMEAELLSKPVSLESKS
jgi:nucleoside phosphorylase